MTRAESGTERSPLLRTSSESSTDVETVVAPTKTKLPWGQLSILVALGVAQPLAFEVIFPFINQMLVELKIVDDPERVGFYSGLIESIFAVTSLMTILPASYASDKVGRKPVILFGITGLGLSLVVFGTARSFLVIIMARCIGGGMGGVWAALKTMTGEITDRSNQDVAFSLLQVAYRIGQIVGLPIGGFFAHPERSLAWTHLFGGWFWREYPFALPCFIGAALAFGGVLFGLVFLRETLHSKEAIVPSQSIIEPSYGGEHHEVEPSIMPIPPPKQKPSMRSVMTPEVVSLMVSNLFMCLASELLFSVFPVFAFTPVESGGLAFSEAQIGGYLAIRSLTQVLMMFFYKPLQDSFLGRGSATRLYQWGMVAWVLSVLFYPLLNFLARQKLLSESTGVEGSVVGSQWFFDFTMLVFFLVWGFGGFCWTCQAIMTNNASPSRDALATIQGVTQISIIVPQAIAPATATSLFAFSIEHQILDGNLVWVAMLIFTAIGAVQAWTGLEDPEHDWREA